MASETIREFLVAVGYKHDETALKKTLTGIGDVTKSIVKLGAIIEATALTVAVGVAKFASNLEQLYFASARTGASATNLKAFGRVAQDFGASAEEAQSSIEGLATFLRSNPMGAEVIGSWFNIKTRDKSGKSLGPDQIMLAMAKSMQAMPQWQALQFGGQAGLSQNTILAMLNPDFLSRFDTLQSRLNKAGFGKAADDAHKFMMGLRDLGDQLVILGTRIEDALQQKLGISLKSISDWVEKNQNWIIDSIVYVVGVFIDQFNIIVAWLTAHGPEIKKMIKEAIVQFDASWKIIKPAMQWVYDKLVELDTATGGWSTKLLALSAILATTGAAGLIGGVLSLAAAFVRLGVGMASVAGGSIVAALGSLGAVLGPIAGAIALISSTFGIGYVFGSAINNFFPNLPEWLGGKFEEFSQWFEKMDQKFVFSKDGNTGARQRWAMDKLQGMGWSEAQAAGMVANATAESSTAESSMDPNAVNGNHYGLFQWDSSRWANFQKYAKANGLDMGDALSQLKFADYEMRFGGEKAAGALLLASQNADQAGRIVSHSYERHGIAGEDERRGAIATQLSQQTTINVYGTKDPNEAARLTSEAHKRATQEAASALVREFASAVPG